MGLYAESIAGAPVAVRYDNYCVSPLASAMSAGQAASLCEAASTLSPTSGR